LGEGVLVGVGREGEEEFGQEKLLDNLLIITTIILLTHQLLSPNLL
jgi:hypothetical protein